MPRCQECKRNVSEDATICNYCGRAILKNENNMVFACDGTKKQIKDDVSEANTENSTSNYGCLIMFGLLILLFFANRQSPTPKTNELKTSEQKPAITTESLKIGLINGFDPNTKTIITPINVFKDYENRNAGITGKAKHGEKITILKQNKGEPPYGVKIKTGSGIVGWVSNWFVKEL